jgi:hypothetical protein
MPQVIPLVVTAITTVTSAVVAAGPLAVAAFNAANVIGAAALANEAFKAVQPSVKSSSTAIEWNADPNAPNRFPFGRVGGAGNIIHNATYGPDKMYVGFVGVMGASGPIKSWISLKADDVFVNFDGSGKAIDSDYAGEMFVRRQRGLQPETSYLPSPAGLKNGAAMPRWGVSYKLSGKAAYHYTLAENSKRSAFKGKVPTGIHTIEGLFCYDPRFDSTYPGGTGPCRLDDPTTWVYSTNAYIHGLNWNIGRWEGLAPSYSPARYGVPYASMKVGGIGARPEGIDFAAYVEGANIFDENQWACAAWPDADQGKGAVLDSFLQAGGGIYAERQGKVSCLHRAAPRASMVTITANDTAGTIEYDTTTSLLERINTIRPEYWSEAHGWQMVATDEVSADLWREEDGQGVAVTRSKGLAYNYVPGSKQARELAALQIAHTREGIRGTAPLRHYLDLDVGDCFTFQVPEAVLNGLKCIVLNVDPDLENDVIHVTFASESDGKYPFAFGQADAPPPAPGLQPGDNTVSPPLPDDWVITPRPPGPGGTLVPGFDLSGVVGNSTATAIEVQWWVVPDGVDPMDQPPEEADWQSAGTWPPTATTIPINVQGNRYYWIGLIYIRGQNYSTRTAIGPWLAGKLIAGGLAPDAAQELLDEATKEVNDKVRDALEQFEKASDLEGLFRAQDDLSEAVLKLGRGVTELQRVTETNTREGGKLVKSIVRVMGGELDNAQAAIVEEAALSLQRDQAEALLREVLALQVDENRATAENSLSALVTDLAAEVTARNALGVRVDEAEGAISAEAMVRANEDGVFTQNFELMGARRPDQSGWILNKETVDLNGEGSFASVLSGLRAIDGENSSSIVTLLSASGNQASQLTTLSNTVGDQTLSISQLLSVTQGLGARYTLSLDGSGAATQFIADGQTRAIVFKAASLTITDDGSGLSYVPATGRLSLTKGGMRTVLGAGGSLILWAGATSIPAGAEVVDNGILGISNEDAWFGGATANGPFTTGSPSGQIDLTKNVWTTVASVAARRLQNEGDLFAQLQFEVNVAGSPDDDNDYTVQFRVAVANLDGTGAVGVVGNFAGFPANTWTAIDTYVRGHVSTVRGPKRLLLQINPTGSTITTASVRSARMDGQYAGASIF